MCIVFFLSSEVNNYLQNCNNTSSSISNINARTILPHHRGIVSQSLSKRMRTFFPPYSSHCLDGRNSSNPKTPETAIGTLIRCRSWQALAIKYHLAKEEEGGGAGFIHHIKLSCGVLGLRCVI